MRMPKNAHVIMHETSSSSYDKNSNPIDLIGDSSTILASKSRKMRIASQPLLTVENDVNKITVADKIKQFESGNKSKSSMYLHDRLELSPDVSNNSTSNVTTLSPIGRSKRQLKYQSVNDSYNPDSDEEGNIAMKTKGCTSFTRKYRKKENTTTDELMKPTTRSHKSISDITSQPIHTQKNKNDIHSKKNDNTLDISQQKFDQQKVDPFYNSPARKKKLDMVAASKKNKRKEKGRHQMYDSSTNDLYTPTLTTYELSQRHDFQPKLLPSPQPDLSWQQHLALWQDSHKVKLKTTDPNLIIQQTHHNISQSFNSQPKMATSNYSPITTDGKYQNTMKSSQTTSIPIVDKPQYPSPGITTQTSRSSFGGTNHLTINYSYNDEDDNTINTEFNSVSTQNNIEAAKTKESSQVAPVSLNQNSIMNNRSNGAQEQDVWHRRRMKQGINAVDDDAASHATYGDESTTTGSWTGRMRAQQAAAAAAMTANIPSSNSVLSKSSTVVKPQDNSLLISSPSMNQSKPVKSPEEEGSDDPAMTALTLGVAGAMIGAVFMGPVGLVVGAATVGLGLGAVQHANETDRSNISTTASSVAKKLHNSAKAANDVITNSCAMFSNFDNVPPKENTKRSLDDNSFITLSDGARPLQQNALSPRKSPSKIRNVNDGFGIPDTMAKDSPSLVPTKVPHRSIPACCRLSRITPVNQIHGLDPSLHPRAWLEVMASAWTSRDEKNEAMEEILILAKDKSQSRMLLDEGILDSLMFIIRSFVTPYIIKQKELNGASIPIETYLADPNFYHSKLAAHCCIAFGKAYCATVHTEGDLVLMSSYNHGSVPIERQVAQMLFENPHHVAIKASKDHNVSTNATTAIGTKNTSKNVYTDALGHTIASSSSYVDMNNPSATGNISHHGDQVFRLTLGMPMHQAESLAKVIVSLADGKLVLPQGDWL